MYAGRLAGRAAAVLSAGAPGYSAVACADGAAAAAPCGTAAWVSGPRRNNVPQITAPDAKMAADHQNAVVYPWTRARPISLPPHWRRSC
jgi:hypothetical protein